MSEKNELLDWYQSINEDEGIAKITVPVLQSVNQELPVEEPKERILIVKPEDKVVEKDKDISLSVFILTKRIQDLLLRLSSLDGPYDEESEKRQELSDKVKALYALLGEKIGEL